MKELYSEQVEDIKSYLEQIGFKNDELQGELLDHLCCRIETKIEEGLTYREAKEIAFSELSPKSIKHIARNIRWQNTKPMKMMRILLLLAVISMTCWIAFAGPKESKIPPPSLEEIATAVATFVQDPPRSAPIGAQFEITSSFGLRIHPIHKVKKMHLGCDMKAPMGTPVLAAGAGQVEKVMIHKRGYGKHIIIAHDSIYTSMYAHLSEILVEEGQMVEAGDIIGKVGSSGTSYGPHLHYEILKCGKRVDPELYIPQP